MKNKDTIRTCSSCTRIKHCPAYSLSSSRAFDLTARSNTNVNYSKHNFSSCAQAKGYFAIPRSGFTLIEVVVALAIFAVAAMALTKVAMQYTQSTANSILRTKAQFIAQNQVALMEINQEQLTGTQSEQISSQGEMWQVDKKAENTISPDIKKIDIQISLYNPDTNKVEAGITNVVFFNYPQKNVQ
nr:type II secretion system minor pseudopilin GspI [Acinetobacter defluvii]